MDVYAQQVDVQADKEADARRAHSLTVLRECIANNAQMLLNTLRVYIKRANFVDDTAERDVVAQEILSATVVEALDHAERFDVGRQPIPWLLRIGLNLILQRRDHMFRTKGREIPVSQFSFGKGEDVDEDSLFGFVTCIVTETPDQYVEGQLQAEYILSLVTSDEAQILRLAVINEFDGNALAKALSITPGAARMRLHRAIEHLRTMWEQIYGPNQE
jgi:DNA-directed RNA polymerase specialized sigma24 family protein